MKKIYILFTTLFTIMNFSILNATSDEECLIEYNDAMNVVAYTENSVEDDSSVLIQVKVENMTENTYVSIVNDYDNTIRNYYYSDTVNGVLTVNSPNIYKKVKYIVKVYTKDQDCESDAVTTYDLITDMFNIYYRYEICNVEGTFIEMCSMFYDTSNMNEDEFLEEAKKEIDYLNRSTFTKIMDFIKEYYLFIIIPILLISGFYIYRIIILKRGRDEKYNKKN